MGRYSNNTLAFLTVDEAAEKIFVFIFIFLGFASLRLVPLLHFLERHCNSLFLGSGLVSGGLPVDSGLLIRIPLHPHLPHQGVSIALFRLLPSLLSAKMGLYPRLVHQVLPRGCLRSYWFLMHAFSPDIFPMQCSGWRPYSDPRSFLLENCFKVNQVLLLPSLTS